MRGAIELNDNGDMSDNEGWATTAKITITRTMNTTNPLLNWITAAADEDDDLLIMSATLVDED